MNAITNYESQFFPCAAILRTEIYKSEIFNLRFRLNKFFIYLCNDFLNLLDFYHQLCLLT
jgi:hypothetical protein